MTELGDIDKTRKTIDYTIPLHEQDMMVRLSFKGSDVLIEMAGKHDSRGLLLFLNQIKTYAELGHSQLLEYDDVVAWIKAEHKKNEEQGNE